MVLEAEQLATVCESSQALIHKAGKRVESQTSFQDTAGRLSEFRERFSISFSSLQIQKEGTILEIKDTFIDSLIYIL